MNLNNPLIENYLSFIGVDDVKDQSRVVFSQAGLLFMKPNSKGIGFNAEEQVSVHTPEFKWEAKMTIYKCPFFIKDELKDGAGKITAKIFFLIPLMNIQNEKVLKGQVVRYLAEMPLYPKSFRALKNIRFEALTPHKVQVTLHLGKIKASVVYEMDSNGLIKAVTSNDRFMKVNGKMVNYPWGGFFSVYDKVGGILIPTHLQAYWEKPEGRFTYFTSTIYNYKNY